MNIIYSKRIVTGKKHIQSNQQHNGGYMGLSEYLVELPIPTTGSILPYVLMAIIGGHSPFLDTPELLYGWLNPIYIHIITILLDPIQIH